MRRGVWSTLAVLAGILFGVMLLLSRRPAAPSETPSLRSADAGGALATPADVTVAPPTPTEAPFDADAAYPNPSIRSRAGPIGSGEEAIRLTLAYFPPELKPHGVKALLVTREELAYWSNNGPASADIPTPDRGAPSSHGPVWVVAVLATDLTPARLMPGMVSDPRPADFAYFAWDANGGRLYEQGVPIRGQLQTYETLIAIPTTDGPIEAATVVPYQPPIPAAPTATLSPSSLATLVAALTAQAIRYLTATPTP